MEIALSNIAACAGILSLAPVLVRLRRGVLGTALESAWRSTAAVWLIWLAVGCLTIPQSSFAAWSDVLWYLAAVLALTPPIAVLGAKRPTSRVWTWFVLVPLVLVLAWPVLPSLRHVGAAVAFSLEEPVVVGYVLVLLMGAGNYLGLRFSLSALLWIGGLLLIVLPLCPVTAGWVFESQLSRPWGTLCLVAAGWIADRQILRSRAVNNESRVPLDRVWRDFRDLFGIVWARRIQERFNEDARRTGLALRLGIDGLEHRAGTSTSEFDSQSLIAAEASLRWLLQKFVEPAWIDRRLER